MGRKRETVKRKKRHKGGRIVIEIMIEPTEIAVHFDGPLANAMRRTLSADSSSVQRFMRTCVTFLDRHLASPLLDEWKKPTQPNGGENDS